MNAKPATLRCSLILQPGATIDRRITETQSGEMMSEICEGHSKSFKLESQARTRFGQRETSLIGVNNQPPMLSSSHPVTPVFFALIARNRVGSD